MNQILFSIDTVGQSFRLSGTKAMVGLVDFQVGGDWKLQVEIPSEPAQWLDVPGVSFSADGVMVFDAFPGAIYRLFGGVVGASGFDLADNGEGYRG